MERTVGVGATTITCNNPVLHSITLLFYFPSTVYQTLHLFWRGKQINVTVKVKYSAFVGLILYLGKGKYFSIWGLFRGRGMWLLKKFTTLINRSDDELLSNDIYIYSLPKTTSVSFPSLSFLFWSQHQHSVPGIPSSIYGHLLEYYTGFFSLFVSKFVCRLPYIDTFISCLFLGGTYFKRMYCWHKYVSSESRLTGQNLFGIF